MEHQHRVPGALINVRNLSHAELLETPHLCESHASARAMGALNSQGARRATREHPSSDEESRTLNEPTSSWIHGAQCITRRGSSLSNSLAKDFDSGADDRMLKSGS
jgi:hypothetical protein